MFFSLSQPRRLAPRTSRVTWPNSAAIFSELIVSRAFIVYARLIGGCLGLRKNPPTQHLGQMPSMLAVGKEFGEREDRLVWRGGLDRPGVGAPFAAKAKCGRSVRAPTHARLILLYMTPSWGFAHGDTRRSERSTRT